MAPIEGRYSAKLKKRLENAAPGSVVIKHPGSVFSSGIPDMSFTWNKTTTWIEVKLIDWEDRLRKMPRNQLLMCRRLAAAGRCWVIIFKMIDEEVVSTLIVHPENINAHDRSIQRVTARFVGEAYPDVIRFIADEMTHFGG